MQEGEKLNYKSKLQDLIDGKINQIEINEDDFFDFQQAWSAFPQRKQVVGKAFKNGKVVYRLSESGNI